MTYAKRHYGYLPEAEEGLGTTEAALEPGPPGA